MYAIVEIAGKQYRVAKDDKLYIPKQTAEEKAKLTFDRVLLVADGDVITVGTPTVEGALVKATVVEHVLGDKVLVFKKKRRKGYRVKRGHRQPYTRVQVESVGISSSKKKKSASSDTDQAVATEESAQ